MPAATAGAERASTSGAVLDSSPYVVRPQPPGPPPGKPPLPAGRRLKRAPSQETMLATSADAQICGDLHRAASRDDPEGGGRARGLCSRRWPTATCGEGGGLRSVEGLRKATSSSPSTVMSSRAQRPRLGGGDGAAARQRKEPSLTLDDAEAPEAAVTVDGEMSERSTVSSRCTRPSPRPRRAACHAAAAAVAHLVGILRRRRGG